MKISDDRYAEDRQKITPVVMDLFRKWGIKQSDQLVLLGLSAKSRSSLRRYGNGHPFPYRKDLMSRIGHLLAIHKYLRLLYPYDLELVYRWLSMPNMRFDGNPPLEIMKKSCAGIISVRRYLEDLSQS